MDSSTSTYHRKCGHMFFLEHSVYTWSDQKHTDSLLAWETDWDQTAQTVPTALQLRTTNCTQREYKLLTWLQFLNSPFSGIFRIKKSSCSHVHTLKCSWDIFGYNRMHNITCKQLNLMPFYISIMCNPQSHSSFIFWTLAKNCKTGSSLKDIICYRYIGSFKHTKSSSITNTIISHAGNTTCAVSTNMDRTLHTQDSIYTAGHEKVPFLFLW